MTPERMARLVARWARLYTRNLPDSAARRRVEEIDADLHDHIAHERAAGTSDRRIAWSIAARMARGLPADASWRARTSRSGLRVVLVTAALLLVPFVAMQFTDEVAWGAFDFVFAAILLGGAGLLIERAMRRPRNRVPRIVAATLGVAAVALGQADDAPGLVLFGLLLLLGSVALTVGTALRSPSRR
jgi:hypothetical protein